jgi:hypothetical protein
MKDARLESTKSERDLGVWQSARANKVLGYIRTNTAHSNVVKYAISKRKTTTY